MASFLEKIIIGLVIVGGIVLVILYGLYLAVTAVQTWLEANPSLAALLTLLLIVLLLTLILAVLRRIEEM